MEKEPLNIAAKDPLKSSWRTHMKDGQWVPDISVQQCMICRFDFSLWNRKHHCRRCGAVVCGSCSNNFTKFIYKEISPKHIAKEEARACDYCIKYIDEKLAVSLHRRYGKSKEVMSYDESLADLKMDTKEEQKEKQVSRPERGNRSMLSAGRYRADIKESEGNRFIRDDDL
uniref:Predicted protein putative n=1 Tax=Albugo laibachii Nc14 TaxID=890382 RepID=F0WAS0_9STRA|nr:predicted protein putative [Albugo laibachii Nc14]|eukprot:CCA18242.1 predicted protein putative [Albugo laibachii Nc14]